MDVDLARHGVVEASAGTGKTYTIQQLVVKMLVEQHADIEEILVVTFTEKATGELRDRIRAELEKRLIDAPAQRDIWHKALDGFDQAPIFTIHGFCHRLLREYALEQGLDFRGTLVSDTVLLEPCLREIQRKNWRSDFGPHLRTVLKLARYDRTCADRWEDRVRNVALSYHPERGHRLLPELPPASVDPDGVENEFRAKLQMVRKLAGMPGADIDGHPWVAGFEDCRMRPQSRSMLVRRYLKPLLNALTDDQITSDPLIWFLDVEESLAKELRDHTTDVFQALYCKGGKKEEIQDKCPGLVEASATLEELHKLGQGQAITEELAVHTIRLLHEHVAEYKRDRGLYSFDDLILQAARALDPKNPGSREFAAMLRRRFRFAIVDEFQDTDPLQWLIFKRVFLEGNDSMPDDTGPGDPVKPPRLFVVGDPKQAIFGFRGADLPTYLRATREMLEQYGAAPYALVENWRSVPELLTSLNRLFREGDWFGEDRAIHYEDVGPPPPQERLNRIDDDRTGRAALSIVNVRDHKNLTDGARHHARFIASEIRRLVDARLEITVKSKKKILTAGDCAVLVFRRGETKALTRALGDRGLPYTLYKQKGLRESDEARDLRLVLEAVANPEDRGAWNKALLSRFFQLNPSDLTMCGDIPPDHVVRRLKEKWVALAERRDWSALCQSLIEDTGVLFREKDSKDFDRLLANYRFLLSRFAERGYSENLDLLDLLCALRDGDDSADGEDVQPIETDDDKVKILTVHASKGLEFPVVFLAGGFTSRGFKETYARYRDDNDNAVFDLRPDAAAKSRADDDEDANDRRLLYVALTRAMFKLYVPRPTTAMEKRSAAGPAVTILVGALKRADPCSLGSEHAVELDPKAPMPAIRPTPRQRGARADSDLLKPADPLFPSLPADLRWRRLAVHSFSSLQRADRILHEGQTFGAPQPRAADEDGEKDPDPLRGPVFGDIVHQVLETIDFAQAGRAGAAHDLLKDESTRRVIDGVVTRQLTRLRTRLPPDQLESACLERVAELVWNALATPLPGLGGPLAMIPPADHLAELEFQYFLDENDTRELARIVGRGPVGGPGEGSENFVTGFMDLVFRKDDRLYLLDWKTNLLDDYDQASLAKAMDESGYQRQYRLYLRALARWLAARHGPAFDFANSVGGVYYLFLRGMNGRADSPGIYHHRPGLDDLEHAL